MQVIHVAKLKKFEKTAKPRRKRKSIILTMKYCLDIHEDDPTIVDEIGQKFRTWMRDHFSNWDQSILQYFLYENNIKQNSEGDRIMLEGHLDKILKDDTLHSKQELIDENANLGNDLQDIENELEPDFLYKDTSSSESTRRPDLLEEQV